MIQEKNFQDLTAVQKKVLPLGLGMQDVIATSRSGTGKTAAYLLPLLQRVAKISKSEHKALRAVVLVPTRELALQVTNNVAEFSKYMKLSYATLSGGIPKAVQKNRLKQGVDIVVATTGRLKAFIDSGELDVSHVSILVADEADILLHEDFLEEFEYIIQLINPKRQMMMFSATLSHNIRHLGKRYMHHPVTIEIHDRRSTVTGIAHTAYKVDLKQKKELLKTLLLESPHTQILIFVNEKDQADSLTAYLKNRKLDAQTIHGDIEFKKRSEWIQAFKKGDLEILVATDIAGRGLDVADLPLVINYELPEKTDDFTHRIGRTARAGKTGEVITLLTTKEYRHFSRIERELKLGIKREIYEGFELTDRQPRQKAFKRKSEQANKQSTTPTKQKQLRKNKKRKTTKRDG